MTHKVLRCMVKDNVQVSHWEPYLNTVTYEEGIRFLQNMDSLNVTNVKFHMVKIDSNMDSLMQTPGKL